MNKPVDNFLSLEEIFDDPVFQQMFSELKPQKVERLDPEVEKFQDLLNWVREHGREPQLTPGNMAEVLKHRYLKGIRQDDNRRAKFLPYDELGLLGGENG